MEDGRWTRDGGWRMEVIKVVDNRIKKWNRCRGITKSKGSQNKRNKESKSKNKGEMKMVYDMVCD